MPTPEYLGTLYPDDYYSFVHEAPTEGPKARWRKRLLPVRTGDPVFARPGSMVDVGCGNGWVVEDYRRNGWDACGVEYSAAGTANGRSRGLDIREGSLHDAAFPDEMFDFVRLNHSFEHMTNPSEVVSEAVRILKPGGRLFIGVPDGDGLTARVFKDNWYYVGAPVHPFTWSRTTLPRFLEDHGLRVDSVRGNSDYGGTTGSLQVWLNRRSDRRSDAGILSGRLRLPAIVIGFWISKLLDRIGRGDCVEVVCVK